MESRTARIALLSLAAFGVLVIGRLGYNLYHYSPAEALLQSVQGDALSGLNQDPPLSHGPEGFYSRSSRIWLAVPDQEFNVALDSAIQALRQNNAAILHQKQRNTEQSRYSVIQVEVPENKAETLLGQWKSNLETLQFEENRNDLQENYAALDAKLQALDRTQTRITINPEQFKLSATSEIGEEAARLQSLKSDFERARLREPRQSLAVILIAKPGLGFSGVAGLFLDALWWSIALFGALSILGLFAFLILRLFQGGKDLLSWLGGKVDSRTTPSSNP